MRISALRDDPPPRGEFELRPWAGGAQPWTSLASPAHGATLSHDDRWLRVLHRAYGFKFAVASIGSGSEPGAACVLARSKNPFNPRAIALPFSDTCPPLAIDQSALADLTAGLIAQRIWRGGYELRGIALPAPWQVVNCFAEWTLDLRQTAAQLERRCAAHFRKKARRAAESGLSVQCGSSLTELKGFYGLMLQTRSRQGVPVQPLRFFKLVREIFNPGGDFEVWLVHQRGRLLAGGIVLRAFGTVHYKWSARGIDRDSGASHLLCRSMFEKHAGAADALNLGRTDVRNAGLARFKKEAGGEPVPLPYSFFPSAPKQISAEVLSGPALVLSQLWSRLPLAATRVLSSAIYRYMA